MDSKKITITGRVQGVFFRKYTQLKAMELGLLGYVRNLPDGSVEAVVHGSAEGVQRFISWCHEGSPLSKVTGVHVDSWTEAESFNSFQIRH
ncbi:MAG: acylphosphatase [Flavobacteriales bacterium]|nr:acylphosphatase [Bacteroidota bacterium]MCB9240033.1 acylphosphatase [Flavobacteriales bacterium]